jgi:hypothetical protein
MRSALPIYLIFPLEPNSNSAMAPLPPHSAASALLSHQSHQSALDVLDDVVPIALLLLSVIILPGFIYAIVAAWDLLWNDRGEEDEVFECECNQSRPMSADRFDEFVVFQRPDLLVTDTVSSQDRKYSDLHSLRSISGSLSSYGSMSSVDSSSRSPLLGGHGATNYGSIDSRLLQ